VPVIINTSDRPIRPILPWDLSHGHGFRAVGKLNGEARSGSVSNGRGMGFGHEKPGCATVLLRCSEGQAPTRTEIDSDPDSDPDPDSDNNPTDPTDPTDSPVELVARPLLPGWSETPPRPCGRLSGWAWGGPVGKTATFTDRLQLGNNC